MATGIVRLYLLCFAYHRFRQINDNLIEAFIHLLDQYEKDAKLSAEAAAQQALLAAILLQTFFVVAEVDQISEAARRLHLSQPAVTGHIPRLEANFETNPFIR